MSNPYVSGPADPALTASSACALNASSCPSGLVCADRVHQSRFSPENSNSSTFKSMYFLHVVSRVCGWWWCYCAATATALIIGLSCSMANVACPSSHSDPLSSPTLALATLGGSTRTIFRLQPYNVLVNLWIVPTRLPPTVARNFRTIRARTREIV